MFRKMASVAFAASTLMSSAAAAQSLSDVPTVYHLSAALGSDLTTVSLAASRSTYVGTSDRFRVGLNIRATGASPRDLKLGPVDPRGPFGPTSDTLAVSSSVMSFNLGVNAIVAITPRLQGGLNIDLFGFSTGPRKDGSYYAKPGETAAAVSAKPASVNIFAAGTGDRGSLNSEFFVSWVLNDRYSVRGGLSHQVLDYEVSVDEVVSGASRFRRYSNLVFLGITMTRPQ